MVAILSLFGKKLPALLSILDEENIIRKEKKPTTIEKHIFNAQTEIKSLRELLGIRYSGNLTKDAA